jgi:DNA invertase Pin-like site-specific DNA recombinase
MIFGYARVSTRKQAENGNSLEDQIMQLQKENCEVIIKEQYTGKTTVRPQFDELVDKLQAGDKLVVTKLDRFARNVIEGIEVIRTLFAKDVKVHVLNVGLLENTAMGKFFLTTLLSVAELEHTMIIERTQMGKEVARTKVGFKDGRPKKFTEYQLQNAIELLNNGHSYTQVEKLTGISKSTLIREKRMVSHL